MKRVILFFVVFCTSLSLFAKVPRNGYITVGYVNSEIGKKGEANPLKSRYGMSISAGYSYFLNKKPILDNFYVGLDWTFLHGDFRQYRIKMSDHIKPSNLDNYKYSADLKENNEIDHTSIGMQFGPSLTMVPYKDLQISTYFRYSPTLDFIETSMDPYDPPTDLRLGSYIESVDYSYGGYYVVGLSASYRIFMVGIEHSWGSVDHRVHTSSGKQNITFNNKGTWFNIGVRLGKGGFSKKKKNYTYDNELTQIY